MIMSNSQYMSNEYSSSNYTGQMRQDLYYAAMSQVTPVAFMASFTDGFSFRNLIEYIKATNTIGNFIFSNTGIKYHKNNETNTLLNSFELYADKLEQYIYESTLPEYIISIEIDKIRSFTKPMKKGSKLQIYKVANDELIYFAIYAPVPKGVQITTNTPTIYHVRTETLDNIVLPMADDNNLEEENPTCILSALELKDTAKQFGIMKGGKKINIRAYQSYIIITTSTLEGKSGIARKFGVDTPPPLSINLDFSQFDNLDTNNIIYTNINPIKAAPVVDNSCVVTEMEISPELMKSISKLSTLPGKVGIKFYFQTDAPMKIVCNIENYGLIRTYIRNV